MASRETRALRHDSAPRPTARRRPRLAAVAATAVLVGTAAARGQTWKPTAGAVYDWNTAADWTGGVVPNSYSADVSLSPAANLTGIQTVDMTSQAVHSLTIGDIGGTYEQELTISFGASSPALNMGGSGVTSTIYANGPILTTGLPPAGCP